MYLDYKFRVLSLPVRNPELARTKSVDKNTTNRVKVKTLRENLERPFEYSKKTATFATRLQKK
jgi:hypothetical protein